MTETARTTVTLSKISMKQIEELVGVFGNTPASVISRIVEHFFDYGKFDDVLVKLRAKKREIFPPDKATIQRKITNLFKAANKIPFQDFCDFLELDRKYALNNLHIWAEEYKIKLVENYIIKEDNGNI